MVKKQIKIAPEFVAIDTNGRQIKLSDYQGKKNVMLVFNRGFQWPYCRKHMAQLRQDYQQFVNRNTEIIAIGPEDSEAFKQWWDDHKMPFTGIADPKHNIANMYGQQVKLIKLGRMPATILIDKRGQIRYSHFGESMADIPKTKEMLSLTDGLDKEDAS